MLEVGLQAGQATGYYDGLCIGRSSAQAAAMQTQAKTVAAVKPATAAPTAAKQYASVLAARTMVSLLTKALVVTSRRPLCCVSAACQY